MELTTKKLRRMKIMKKNPNFFLVWKIQGAIIWN